MADNVSVQYVFRGGRKVAVRLSSKSDGTGETLVRKVALSDLTFSDGRSPDALVVEKVSWSMFGFESIELFFDRPGAAPFLRLAAGQGEICYRDGGGLQDPKRDLGGTGDILLTSNGATSGDNYEILLELRQKRL